MRKQIVAGNWKMNLNHAEVASLIRDIKPHAQHTVMVYPPSIFVHEAKAQADQIIVGTQDISAHDNGAYTGEISASMLNSMDIAWTLIGHSERRQYHGETNTLLNQKIHKALDHKIQVIYCIGETLEEREQNQHWDVIKAQIADGLKDVSKDAMNHIVLAYEPVWAIGTGLTATPEQAQEAHAKIRQFVTELYDQATADKLSILYGGSCKPNNAKEIFSQPDVDGGLIGGAALVANDFNAIIDAL